MFRKLGLWTSTFVASTVIFSLLSFSCISCYNGMINPVAASAEEEENTNDKGLSEKEVTIVIVNTIKALNASNMINAFVHDKINRYNLMRVIEIALYHLEYNPNLTYEDLYFYTYIYLNTMYNVSEDCPLYYSTHTFLRLLKFPDVKKGGNNIITVRTRQTAHITVTFLQKLLKEKAKEFSI